MEFSSITISFFIHSTEDDERLMNLVRERFGLEDSEISREKIVGHFGNEMISVRAHVIGPKSQALAIQIANLLSKSARTFMRAEIEKSLDEHDSLFLRLDRQALQEPFVSLSDEEPIRIKLKPKSRSGGRESMMKQYMELIG